MSNTEIVLMDLASRLTTKKRSIKLSNGGTNDFIYVDDLVKCFNELINENKEKENFPKLIVR